MNRTLFNDVVKAVGKEYNVPIADLLSKRRNQPTAWARQVAVHLCHRISPSTSWSDLGRWFERDRTTVRYAHNLVADIRGQGEDLDHLLRKLEDECTTTPVRTRTNLETAIDSGLADKLGYRPRRD